MVVRKTQNRSLITLSLMPSLTTPNQTQTRFFYEVGLMRTVVEATLQQGNRAEEPDTLQKTLREQVWGESMDEQEKLYVLITPDHTLVGREGGKVLMDFAPSKIVVELPNSERLPIGELIDYYRKYIEDKIKSI